jgi:hypothetical protein
MTSSEKQDSFMASDGKFRQFFDDKVPEGVKTQMLD